MGLLRLNFRAFELILSFSVVGRETVRSRGGSRAHGATFNEFSSFRKSKGGSPGSMPRFASKKRRSIFATSSRGPRRPTVRTVNFELWCWAAHISGSTSLGLAFLCGSAREDVARERESPSTQKCHTLASGRHRRCSRELSVPRARERARRRAVGILR